MNKRIQGIAGIVPAIFLALVMIGAIAGISPGTANADVYWVDTFTGARLDEGINLSVGEERTLRLTTDVPEGKILKAYSFDVSYNKEFIQIIEKPAKVIEKTVDGNDWTYSAISDTYDDGDFSVNGGPHLPPSDPTTNPSGSDGGDDGVVGILDVKVKGLKEGGAGAFDIEVKNFGDSDGDFDPLPTAKDAPVKVGGQVYWTDEAGNRLDELAMAIADSEKIFLVTDVPDGKTLKAFKFSVKYDDTLASIGNIQQIAPFQGGLNTSTAGTIIFNGFSSEGKAGPGAAQLLSLTITGNQNGRFDMETALLNFGDTTDFDAAIQPKTEPYMPVIIGDGGPAITAIAGVGGTIVSGSERVASGSQKVFPVAAGDDIAFRIIPNSGYTVKDVLVDGVSVGARSLHTFTNVTENGKIEAVFKYTGVSPLPPVVPAPSANFEADVKEGTAPLKVKFTDKSSGTIYSHKWDFGDEASGDKNTSTEKNPVHIYEKPGKYKVKLTVTGPGGSDTEAKVSYITVTGSANKASFDVEYKVDGDPLKVRLTDTSTGEVISRKWFVNGEEVGNGEETLVYTFPKEGTYTVRLEVTGDGWTDTTEKEITTEGGQGLLVPAFEFTIGTDNRMEVLFTDKSEPADKIVLRTWDFGDGTTEQTADPEIIHVYAKDGKYPVKLTVLTESGKTASASIDVIIGGSDSIHPPGAINASFTVDKTSGAAPLAVKFSDASTSDHGISLRIWEFGDGNTSFATNPTYTYTTEGSFTPKLTVVGPDGTATMTLATPIKVTIVSSSVVSAPQPAFPSNGATMELEGFHLKDALKVADYSDADNPYHVTRWEIATDPGFAETNVVWRETSTSTSLYLPNFVVDFDSAYYWRAQFIDKNGLASEFSSPFSFTVAATSTDDSDTLRGVLDAQTADCAAVFDGMAIAKCVNSAIEGKNGVFGVELMNGANSLTFLRAFGETYTPEGIDMPWGSIGFKVMTGLGEEAQVTIHLSKAASDQANWFVKEVWGLMPSKRDDGEVSASSAAVWAADRKSVTLTLADGGENDFDGIANGAIVVPFTGFGEGGGVKCCDDDGGSDSCFIGTASGASASGIFALFLSMIGVVMTRIHRR